MLDLYEKMTENISKLCANLFLFLATHRKTMAGKCPAQLLLYKYLEVED